MNPERWRQVNDLFHAALERRPDERLGFIDSQAGGDAELAREVRSLLASHDASEEFLAQPAYEVAAGLILDESERSLARRQIGPYRVLEEIGRGGMGIVYAAVDTRLGRDVALKALPPEYASDPVRRHRLTREAKTAASLSHPAIATVFALEEIDGELFLITELVKGRTLREELRQGPLPPSAVLETLFDIASALGAAHDAGIVHRDLKPENIVRCSDGRVKVLDFGLAKAVAGQTHTTARLTERGIAAGTPGYMSPEQLRGAEVDARTDIFAFGILGWELATGRHPLGVDNAELVAGLADLTEGRGLASLSQPLPVPGLSVVLRRCLRTDPAERYASGGALLQDLRTLRAGGDTGAVSAAPSGDAIWWWRFHQVAVSVVNGLTPVAGWYVRRWAEARPYGTIAFFLILALATVSVTLRLNLLFVSRVHPTALARHRARFFVHMAVAEGVLAMVLLASAALVAGPYDGMAALLVTLAVVTLASLGIIEPATTAAAGIKETQN